MLIRISFLSKKTFGNEIRLTKTIKIGILGFPSTKYNICKNTDSIYIENIGLDLSTDTNVFPQISKYKSLFDFNIKNKTKDIDYKFENYRDDISLSTGFYFLNKTIELENYDYVFIPPIGLKFDEKYLNNLYEKLIHIQKHTFNHCFYQISSSIGKGIIENVENFVSVQSKYPDSLKYISNGILLKPQTLRRMEFFGRSLYYIDRFDKNLHVFCEIGNIPILLITDN